MGEIEWAMWANEQAVAGAILVFVGGIIAVAAKFKYWEIAAACIVTSLLILIVEWPRSKRKRGNTIERRYQSFLVPIVDKLGPLGSNYYVRFVGQIVMGVPACFLLPTILGGVSLFLSAFVYLLAAVKGEQWLPVKPRPPPGPKDLTRSEPPSHPPPRNPKRDRNFKPSEENNRY